MFCLILHNSLFLDERESNVSKKA